MQSLMQSSGSLIHTVIMHPAEREGNALSQHAVCATPRPLERRALAVGMHFLLLLAVSAL